MVPTTRSIPSLAAVQTFSTAAVAMVKSMSTSGLVSGKTRLQFCGICDQNASQKRLSGPNDIETRHKLHIL